MKDPIFWFLVALLVFVGAASSCTPYDDTDDLSARERSGMRLFIDRRTGCHYLGGPFGGITPRLNDDGTHLCESLQGSPQ